MPRGISKNGVNKGQFKKGSRGFTGKHTKKTILKISEMVKKAWQEGRLKPRWGFRCTEETKKKMSESHKGRKAWNKGKHYMPSSDSLKNLGYKWPREKEGPMSGKHHSEETKTKISKAKRGKCGGEKCHLWKGGITPENKRIRRSSNFIQWRKFVFTRDNYTCQKCKDKSGSGYMVYLEPHHIQNFSQYTELRFVVDNGITLCKKCHQSFHNKYGRLNNTKEQIEKYLKENKKTAFPVKK